MRGSVCRFVPGGTNRGFYDGIDIEYEVDTTSNLETNWSSAEYQEYFIGHVIKFGTNSLKLVERSISGVFQRSSDQIWKEFTVHSGGLGGVTPNLIRLHLKVSHVCKIRILTYPDLSWFKCVQRYSLSSQQSNIPQQWHRRAWL